MLVCLFGGPLPHALDVIPFCANLRHDMVMILDSMIPIPPIRDVIFQYLVEPMPTSTPYWQSQHRFLTTCRKIRVMTPDIPLAGSQPRDRPCEISGVRALVG